MFQIYMLMKEKLTVYSFFRQVDWSNANLVAICNLLTDCSPLPFQIELCLIVAASQLNFI